VSDEDALICDFAEYYHVLSWRSLPVKLAATLAAGFPATSRSRMTLAGQAVSLEQCLLATIADSLHQLQWQFFGDRNSPPPSILAALRGEENSGDIQSFNSPEEFEAAMAAVEGGAAVGD